MREPPDPYAAARAFAQSLERLGVDPEKIVDAMMVTAINASARLNGPEVVALTLRGMAVAIAGDDPETPPTAH